MPGSVTASHRPWLLATTPSARRDPNCVRAPTRAMTRPNGRLCSVTDWNNRTVSYAYDGNGRLASVTDRENGTTRYCYDGYDATNRVLTIVQYTRPEGASEYVNSMWEIQKHPFSGDVINSYNDGPPKPGASQFGEVYELETSSPAAALAPGAALVHRHRTIHLAGGVAALDPVARKVLGVGLDEIVAAFN